MVRPCAVCDPNSAVRAGLRVCGSAGLRDPRLALEGGTDADLGTTRLASWVHSIRSPSVRFCCIRFDRPIFLGVGGPPSACRAEGTCPLVRVPVLLQPALGPRGHILLLPCPVALDRSRQRETLAGGGRCWGRVGVRSLTSPQAHVSSAPAQAVIGAPSPAPSCLGVLSVSWCSCPQDPVPPLPLSLSWAHGFEKTPFVQLFVIIQLASCREPDIYSQAAAKFMNSFPFQDPLWVR